MSYFVTDVIVLSFSHVIISSSTWKKKEVDFRSFLGVAVIYAKLYLFFGWLNHFRSTNGLHSSLKRFYFYRTLVVPPSKSSCSLSDHETEFSYNLIYVHHGFFTFNMMSFMRKTYLLIHSIDLFFDTSFWRRPLFVKKCLRLLILLRTGHHTQAVYDKFIFVDPTHVAEYGH